MNRSIEALRRKARAAGVDFDPEGGFHLVAVDCQFCCVIKLSCGGLPPPPPQEVTT